MAHVVVIEDEQKLRELLVRLLTSAGYRVSAAATGSSGLRIARENQHDLVLLDLMLPDLAGEEVLRLLLAANQDERVLVLSSVAEMGRRIGVLTAGASDFVAKPFVNGDLLARIRLRIRERSTPAATSPLVAIDREASLDLHRCELVVNDHRVSLSQREFTLLTHLLDRKGMACSRQELLAEVWGVGFDPGTNVVDVYVRRLRAKLAPKTIETVRNVGYRLVAC